jgi:hypothetical protein
MKRTELLLTGMSVACLGLYLLGTPGISLFLMLLISLLGVLFGYFGFAHLNGIRLAQVFKRESYTDIRRGNLVLAVFAGLGMGALINGILFRILFWEQSDFLLELGLIWTSLTLILTLVWQTVSPVLKQRILLRAAILIGTSIICFALPAHTWFAIRYRAQPEYVEAMKNYRYAPSEETLRVLEEVREGIR